MLNNISINGEITLDEFKDKYKSTILELRELMNQGNSLVKGVRSELKDPYYYSNGTVIFGNREYSEKQLGENAWILTNIQLKINKLVRECKYIMYFNPVDNDMGLCNVAE